ncbi:hypothetical protein [Vibrio phage R01]|nr:hypothetical protein [Vibrio phage R01]
MATINNFDQSSTGVNLELAIFWDTDQSQRDFSECLERTKIDTPDRYYGDVFFFTDFGNDVIIENESKNYLVDCDAKTLIKKAFAHVGGDLREFLRDAEISTKDNIDLILGQLESYFHYESNYLEFLSANFELDFHLYQTRGYSQGDAATVLISKKHENPEKLHEWIDHLFWDAPLYARLTVNDDQEIYLDELLTDRYTYDKDDLIEEFKKQHGEIANLDLLLEFLEENLPETPDHL